MQTFNPPPELRVPRYPFSFEEVAEPCLSCPNSASNAFAKPGDRSMSPKLTAAVQYPWQVKMKVLPIAHSNREPKPKAHVVQKIESGPTFTTGGAGYTACHNP